MREPTRPGRGRSWTILRSAGAALAAVSVGWVLWAIHANFQQLPPRLLEGPVLLVVVLATPAYALLLTLSALAWWWLLGAYDRRSGAIEGYAVWARPQVAKYLPGNVFHYVGRQVLGRRIGLSHTSLVAAGVLELVSILLASLLMAIGGLALRGADRFSILPYGVGALLLVTALLAWPFLDRIFRLTRGSLSWVADLPRLSPARVVVLVGPALLAHALFFSGCGILLYVLLRIGWPDAQVTMRDLFWLYPLAYAAGLVAAGAPGGLGVREAILTLELQSTLGTGNAAALAVAFRVVTLLGDLLTTTAGNFLYRGSADAEPQTDRRETS